MAIDIRPVTTIEECRAIEKITQAAWGGGYEISVPDHLTITIARENGGVVLLARDGDLPVGFCLGFLSYVGEEKRLKHCSHLAGVIPEYRGKRVGEQLKWAQREAVLAMGIDHITWTYDPLETLNGRLNIHKLGAICNSYKRDVYGAVRDALNRGVPTDRFYVDWWLTSSWVKAHKDGSHKSLSYRDWLNIGAMTANLPRLDDGLWHCGDILDEAFRGNHILAAVPKHFQQLKKVDAELSMTWRLHTRTMFERAFANGYVVIDLLVEDSLCYYLLERGFKASYYPGTGAGSVTVNDKSSPITSATT